MAKVKTMFYCSTCGHASGKWIGKCPSCGEWNTFVEELIAPAAVLSRPGGLSGAAPIRVHEVTSQSEKRIDTKSTELNRVLGGGLVPGSIVLIGGEPGIGKSTLLLQMALNMTGVRILYLSGEESVHQIKMRAERLEGSNPECFLLNETEVSQLFTHTQELKPDLVVIDSIQTMHTSLLESSAGSIAQIRESAAALQRFAKESNIPVLLIGHITKDGHLAGPKILEHMVDAVLQFEGDQHYGFRVLRSAKNRYGSTSELGIFEMGAKGLREVINPSELLLSQRDEQTSGVSIAAMVEGMRPMMIETQALVGTAVYGTPQRSSTGFDLRRLNMLLAVIEKRSGFRLSSKDVFMNIAGGLRVDDPAIDLAVVAAIISSATDTPIDAEVCFAGEVGLSGEIRAVSRMESRILEAEKLGFKQIYLSKYGIKGINRESLKIQLVPLAHVADLVKKLLGNP